MDAPPHAAHAKQESAQHVPAAIQHAVLDAKCAIQERLKVAAVEGAAVRHVRLVVAAARYEENVITLAAALD